MFKSSLSSLISLDLRHSSSHPAAEFFQDAVVADGFADHPRSTSLPGMVGWRAREVNETAGA
jgi:hypothetical protein